MSRSTSRMLRSGAFGQLLDKATADLDLPNHNAGPTTTKNTLSVAPDKVRLNPMHARLPVSQNKDNVAALAESIKANGQVTPAYGWKLDEPDPDGCLYELVYGARRRAACALLGIDLKIEISPIPVAAIDVARMMHAENQARQDYSPLESAMEYRAFLDAGLFTSARDLASKLGADESQVSRTLRLLDLPPVVLKLFHDHPEWLPLRKGANLAVACEDAKNRSKVEQVAAQWTDSGDTGNPLAALVAATLDTAKLQEPFELCTPAGVRFGEVRGSFKNGPITIRLASGAPSDLRTKIQDLLNSYSAHS